MGDDLAVVNAALVSYGKRSDWLIPPPGQTDGHGPLLKPEDEQLLNQCRDTPLHRSPFSHVFLKVHVLAPIHTARQLGKYEHLSWNEISAPSNLHNLDFHQPIMFRASVADKKQGSGPALTGDTASEAHRIFNTVMDDAYDRYDELLALGLCEEQARAVLPLNTMTEWVWSGSLGAWAKMCKLRLGKDAQTEAREVAEELSSIAHAFFPTSWDALMSNGVVIDD